MNVYFTSAKNNLKLCTKKSHSLLIYMNFLCSPWHLPVLPHSPRALLVEEDW